MENTVTSETKSENTTTVVRLPPTQEVVLNAALEYAARGWLVFPGRFMRDPKTGKVIKKSWKEGKFKRDPETGKKVEAGGPRWGVTRDPNIIREDFAHPSRLAIGVETGAV